MKLNAFLTGLFLNYSILPANSARAETCPDDRYVEGNVLITRQPGGSGACYLSVDPVDFNGGLTRSYLYSNDGSLMIFDSYANTDLPDDTGARVLYFFPVQRANDFRSQAGGIVVSGNTGGVDFRFDTESQALTRISKMSVRIDPKITPKNAGGLTISSSEITYLDCGYAKGSDPRSKRSTTSEFHNSRGERCPLSNSDLFKYLPGGDVEPRWKNIGIKAFLIRKCGWSI